MAIRVLWLSTGAGMLHDTNSYHGGGWVASLQQLVANDKSVSLAIAFLSDRAMDKLEQDGVVYYPIYKEKTTAIQKLRYYYGGYKKIDHSLYIERVKDVIDDFKPDVIHCFGMETPLASILGQTDIPVVVHLQGLLSSFSEAFFPPGINKFSFLWPVTIREYVLRNNFIFAYNSMCSRASYEKALFKKLHYCMGRTAWDKNVSRLLAPQSVYFHCDEVLRVPFYDHAGQWRLAEKKLRVVSTISNTIYKGLDLILKTASNLTNAGIDFVWNVIGIEAQCDLVRFFEHSLGIQSVKVNVHYMGVMQADEIVSALLQSSVYVHPSYIDNSPNSLCEAQILGLPVIGTYVGGIPSLIENRVTGILVPANGSYELAYLLQYIQGHPDFCRELSHNGFAVAMKRHNKEKILKELITVYNKLAG